MERISDVLRCQVQRSPARYRSNAGTSSAERSHGDTPLPLPNMALLCRVKRRDFPAQAEQPVLIAATYVNLFRC